MSSVHCVVVWEWQCNSQWLPHTPGVTRTLERAYAKKLTRVVLADADPALRGHYVNLRTLTQCLDTSEGGTGGAGDAGFAECRVRRACYSVQSPAGRGARWEWARIQAPPLAAELNYEPLPMEVQCLLEQSWSAGGEPVPCEGWVLSVARMTAHARAGGGVRLLRRAPHPPYPLTRSEPPPPPPPPPPAPPTPPDRPAFQGRRPRIPQQHTGSSVQSVQSVQSVHSVQSLHSAQSVQAARAQGGARSASPRDRKPGLARQILHNLNIFSHANKQSQPLPAAAAAADTAETETEASGSESPEARRHTDTEEGSTRSARRHSVDTVSTYLSHESKESLQQAAVGELLNCSAGSDDVFESPPPLPLPLPLPGDEPTSDGSIVGVDEASSSVCVWVRAVACPQWGALCPACLRPLDEGAAPAVALTACQHMLHLHCLNRQLEKLRADQEPLYIECLVCGRVYGRAGAGAGAGGAQPPGSMAWALQPPAHSHPHAAASILVTYNFQSGRQGALHPAPGAPYYAVGFPRHTLLPDTPLGRQVLAALRAAWERRLLFTVSASQTTGREHVVAWRVAPPPPPPHQHPPRQLLAALHRLHHLLQEHHHHQHHGHQQHT